MLKRHSEFFKNPDCRDCIPGDETRADCVPDDLSGGNLPGIEKPRAMVFSVRMRKGLAAALTVGVSASGVEYYERRMAVIRWPWAKEEEKPAMPLDEQLSVMLGKRLESRSAGEP